MTKKELEEYVDDLLKTIEELRGAAPVEVTVVDPMVEKLSRLLDECEEKIPAFFYGKGWRASIR